MVIESQKEFLDAVTDYAITHLTALKLNGVKKQFSFSLECGILEDFNYFDITKAPRYAAMFCALHKAKGPVLYWMEMAPGTDTQDPIRRLSAYKLLKHKNTPALRSNINYDSDTLYVGKVKSGICGRIVTHLGFFKVAQTQGLQLFYWAKEANLCLTLHVIEFEKEMENILPIFEYSFAKKLRPLIGKHT